MRSLNTHELNCVAGGLQQRSTAATGLEARHPGGSGVAPYLMKPINPGTGGGGGGYSGYVGDLTDVGSHPGHDYITFDTDTQGTAITTNDRIVVGQQVGTNEYSVELQTPATGPGTDGVHTDLFDWSRWVLAGEGVLHIVVGGLMVAAGADMTIDTAGTALVTGVPEESILFGGYQIDQGIGMIEMAW